MCASQCVYFGWVLLNASVKSATSWRRNGTDGVPLPLYLEKGEGRKSVSEATEEGWNLRERWPSKQCFCNGLEVGLRDDGPVTVAFRCRCRSTVPFIFFRSGVQGQHLEGKKIARFTPYTCQIIASTLCQRPQSSGF